MPCLRTVHGRPPNPDEAQAAADRGARWIERARAASDLEAAEHAVAELRTAIRLATDPAKRARHHNDLGVALQTIFTLSQDIAVLDDAIIIARRGIALFPPNDPARAVALNTLGGMLFTRAEHTGNGDDLDAAIVTLAEARDSITPDSPCITANRSNLAMALLMRFDRNRRQRDLDEAIALLREAERGIPEDAPARASIESNLGNALRDRYERTSHAIADLDEAVALLQSAYRRLGSTDSRRPAVAQNLSVCLRERFRLSGQSADADESVRVLRQAMSVLSADDPHHERLANHLSDALSLRPGFDGEPPVPVRATAPASAADRITWAYANAAAGRPTDSIKEMKRVAYSGEASTADQIEAAIAWARIASDVAPAEALTAYTIVLDRIPELVGADLDEQSSLLSSIEFNGIASAAAALAIEVGRPEEAVEILEHGRLLWWALLGGAQLPERQRFADLAEAAADGPVIILNAGPRRCDALVLTRGGLLAVPLDVELLEARDQAVEFAALWDSADDDPPDPDGQVERRAANVLTWLSDKVTGPVAARMREAGLLRDRDQRVWWCPTGVFSLLPWHAAALDEVVSSYAPNLRTLLDSRRQPRDREPRLVTIGVNQAPGLHPLPLAEDEARQVGALFAEPVVLVGTEATRQRVLAVLPQATWLHLACHARQSMEDPLDSGIALADQRLPVGDLLRLSVPNGEFAFLSACETGQIKPGMTDEVVTVAMALHRAGYPSVVATARSINDALARRVAR